mgnify:CR=1 FL=1
MRGCSERTPSATCSLISSASRARHQPDTPTLFVGERRSARMFIVSDPEGDLYLTSSTVRGDNILVIVGRNVTEEYLAHLRELRISYVIVSDATRLREGLEAVGHDFGIRSISVQGGGILNGALLAERLIDELSLVVYPGIDGLSGVSPSSNI